MSKRCFIAIMLVMSMMVSMSACTIHDTPFGDEYKAVSDFGTRFADKMGKIMDLWRADINSLSESNLEASMNMMHAFVEGPLSSENQDKIVEFLMDTNEALEILGEHNFKIFSNDADGQLNAEVIAQLCLTMRMMTRVQKDLFYEYLRSTDDNTFYNEISNDTAKKEYLDKTISNVRTLISTGLGEVRTANPTVNLSDIRIAMVTEFGRAVSVKHNYFIKANSENNIDNAAFDFIITPQIKTLMYSDYDLTDPAQMQEVDTMIANAKQGIKDFLTILPRGSERDTIVNSLYAIQYRALDPISIYIPPTPTSTPTPTPTATVIPTTKPTPTPAPPIDISGQQITDPIKQDPKNPIISVPKEADPNNFTIDINKENFGKLLDSESFAFVTDNGLRIAFDNIAGQYMADKLTDEKPSIIINGMVLNDKEMLIDRRYEDVVGNRPVFSITINAGGEVLPEIKGYMLVSFPYELQPGEDINSIVVARNGVNVFSAYNTEEKRLYIITDQITTYGFAYNKITFPDSDMWAAEWIEYLTSREVIIGRENGNFMPYDNVTRAEFVTMLARIAEVNLNVATTEKPFSDIPIDEWYASAVAWGADKGVVLGVGDDIYEPDRFITREEIAAMLQRFVVNEAVDHYYPLPVEIEKTIYNDDNLISDWANKDVYDMQQALIMIGDNNTFRPQDSTNRAEAATCLAKLVQKMTVYFIEHAPVIKGITWN